MTARIGLTSRSTAATAIRVAANVALAYAVAGGATLVFLVAASTIAPGPGPGILSGWIFEMCLLAFGAPAVAIVLAGLEFALRETERPRRLAIRVSLVPAVGMGLIGIFEPEVAYLVLWLAFVGLVFGLTMRLPKFSV